MKDSRFPALMLALAFALPVLAAEGDDPVETAIAACLRDGTHWNRPAPLLALGDAAVEPLRRVVAAPAGGEERRVLAAQALGRLGAPAAAGTLRDVAAAKETPEPVRAAAEEALYLLGDTAAIDARIEGLLTRYGGIAIAREGAWHRIAQTYAATGRFASAARVGRGLVESCRDDGRRGYYHYALACYEALAGNRDAARRAAIAALEWKRVDLDWMARDGDLSLLRDDAAFGAALEAARLRRGARARPSPDSAEPSADERAFDDFSQSYWQGAMEPYIAAMNRYWEGYREWMESEGGAPDEAAERAWRESRPEPSNPTAEWIPRFLEWMKKAEGTPLAGRVRERLLMIYGNEQMAAEWTELFVSSLSRTPDDKSLGDFAGQALYFSERAGRRDELVALLERTIAEHPTAPSGAGILIALAQQQLTSGDEAAARGLYDRVIARFPGTRHAEEAKGALYEMESLRPGQPAPAFATADIHGRPITLASLKGKVVLLDFWATWCGPCIGELPHLKKLHAELAGRDDFVLIGVSLDQDGPALVDFLEREKMTWPQICGLAGSDEELARLYNVRGIPDTCLIDRAGRIVARGLRGEDLLPAVRRALDALESD